jgi:hypothetical protein
MKDGKTLIDAIKNSVVSTLGNHQTGCGSRRTTPAHVVKD